jgi:hypothetical protein
VKRPLTARGRDLVGGAFGTGTSTATTVTLRSSSRARARDIPIHRISSVAPHDGPPDGAFHSGPSPNDHRTSAPRRQPVLFLRIFPCFPAFHPVTSVAALRYRAYSLYGMRPAGEPAPTEPVGRPSVLGEVRIRQPLPARPGVERRAHQPLSTERLARRDAEWRRARGDLACANRGSVNRTEGPVRTVLAQAPTVAERGLRI